MQTFLLATAIYIVVIAATILLHYESLRQLSLWLPRLSVKPQLKVVIGLSGALLAHILEVWLFAVAYLVMVHVPGLGSLEGNFDGSLLDSAYFSFTTYSSLGYGDIEPLGALRFLAGLETLTGLVLITWTASFMYIEMTRYWKE